MKISRESTELLTTMPITLTFFWFPGPNIPKNPRTPCSQRTIRQVCRRMSKGIESKNAANCWHADKISFTHSYLNDRYPMINTRYGWVLKDNYYYFFFLPIYLFFKNNNHQVLNSQGKVKQKVYNKYTGSLFDLKYYWMMRPNSPKQLFKDVLISKLFFGKFI